MDAQLEKKIQQAIRLIKMAGADGDVVEVAYSGGKDSEIILQLTKEAGINYRAIYKNTTIDPPGTLKHVKEMGAEIRNPENTFFQLIEKKGFPSRFVRFCCSELKEYKILDKNILGVRKEESVSRNERYTEPTKCLFYGSKNNHVEAFYPILEWNSKDVVEFIQDRGIKCHPLYYDDNGVFHVERRLGCLCCPLVYRKKRINEFKKFPNMVKSYIRAGKKFRESHPNAAFTQNYDTIYDAFVRFLFYDCDLDFKQAQVGLFSPIDHKSFLEEYFNIKL